MPDDGDYSMKCNPGSSRQEYVKHKEYEKYLKEQLGENLYEIVTKPTVTRSLLSTSEICITCAHGM